MFFMRIGLGELLVCAALFAALILIPLIAYWKARRMERGE
jgi:Na+/serine symporter